MPNPLDRYLSDEEYQDLLRARSFDRITWDIADKKKSENQYDDTFRGDKPLFSIIVNGDLNDVAASILNALEYRINRSPNLTYEEIKPLVDGLNTLVWPLIKVE